MITQDVTEKDRLARGNRYCRYCRHGDGDEETLYSSTMNSSHPIPGSLRTAWSEIHVFAARQYYALPY